MRTRDGVRAPTCERPDNDGCQLGAVELPMQGQWFTIHSDGDSTTGAWTHVIPIRMRLRAIEFVRIVFRTALVPDGDFLWLGINEQEVGWDGGITFATTDPNGPPDPAPGQNLASFAFAKVPVTAATGAIQMYEPNHPVIREWHGGSRPNSQRLAFTLRDRLGALYPTGAAAQRVARCTVTLKVYAESV